MKDEFIKIVIEIYQKHNGIADYSFLQYKSLKLKLTRERINNIYMSSKVNPELKIPIPSSHEYITNTSPQKQVDNNQSVLQTTQEQQNKSYETYKKYDSRSLYIFSYTWYFRQKLIDFLSWRYYDYLMVLSIIGNSIVLALGDYSDDDNLTEWNQRLDKIDQAFTILYICEAAIKIIAFGFIFHRKSYLRDPWNVIDFVVVVIGIISLVPNLPNLKSLRIFRIFRPLRSINAVPSIKRLVATLLMSLPQMGYLVSFLLFFITIFAILGIQLFARDLYHRCRLTDSPIIDSNGTISWPIDPTQVRPCGGFYQCRAGTYCHSLLEFKLPLALDKVGEWDYIQNGYFQFDNLGAAIMAIFRLITLEGWTYYMYLYMDCSGPIASIYFPILIVMGSFFFLNLFLAVITDTFSEMVKVQQQQDQEANARLLGGASKKLSGGISKDGQVSAMINVTKKKAQIAGGIGNLSDAALMFLAKAKEEQKREREESEMIQASILNSQKEVKSYASNQSNPPEQQRLQPLGAAEEIMKNSADGINDPEADASEKQIKEIKRESALEVILNQELQKTQSKTCGEQIHTLFNIISNSIIFILFINLCIVANTACLGLDYWPVNAELSSELDKVNIGFFVIFFLEMLIKVIGLGPKTYIKDAYNIFDALIVTLSIIDVCVSASLPDDVKMGKGAISVFRAFRLLRVFKLAKSWKQLNQLIQTIAKSLKDISSFSVLLFLLMFIYVLLGMQLFADKNYVQGSQRVNFRTFFNGFVLIFTVLTGENWDSNMFIFVKTYGGVAIVYFFTLIIIGQMIFMNVFQAILLENFENGGDEDDENTKDEAGEEYLSEIINNFFSNSYGIFKQKISEIFTFKKVNTVQRSESGGMSGIMSLEQSNDQGDSSGNQQLYSGNQAGISSPRQEHAIPIKVEQIRSQNNSLVVHEENLMDQEDQGKMGPFQDFHREEMPIDFYHSSENNIMEPVIFNHTQRNLAIGSITMKPKNLADISLPAAFSLEDTAQISLLKQQTMIGMQAETVLDMRGGQGNMTARDARKNLLFRDNTTNAGGESVEVRAGVFAQSLAAGVNMQLNKSQTQTELNEAQYIMGNTSTLSPIKSHLNVPNQRKTSNINLNGGHNSQESRKNLSVMSGQSPGKLGQIKRSETKSIALILLQKSIDKTAIEKNQSGNHQYECEGNSLYVFGPRNCFRCYVDQFVKGKPFDYFILLLIAFSSVNLALDNPLNNPNSTLTDYLLLSDYVFTSFFIGEGVLKIISQGFLFNGEISYLRNGWNIIDFLVVIISVVSITVTGNKYKFVKIFRLLRILRPLRVASKNKGLRIGIQALLVAIPRLFNVTIISLLFFIICGIIGVNYFKGTFYTCIFGPQFPDEWNTQVYKYVETKYDCLNLGGTWMNADQNFDNLPQAISTLFQMSTTEGWIDVMNRGVDAVGPDMQPIQEFNVYWCLFFMVFIFFGNFLILNLFTGVVCDTYNSEKEILGKNYLLSENQKKWLEYKRMCIGLTPKFVLEEEDIGKFSHSIYRLVTNKKFELFTLACIMLNTATLCINWYSQSVKVDDMLDYINYGFAGIFLAEALLKLTAFGFRTYFRETGNIFDFVIVMSSIISTIISLTMDVDFGSSTTFIRALRMTRIFKFIKEAKGMKVIFDTLIITVPAITNIGGLLLLLLFMFSILGVFLFAEIKLQTTMEDHTNFQSFGIAFLTLLRCSTGEGWNSIMQDTMRQKSILFQCSDDDFEYDTYAANGYQTNGCGAGGAGMAFFIAYFLLIPLFFLDIFVAIIIEGFEQSSNKANNLIQEEDYEHFRECWVKFDRDGTGFISIPDFALMMFMLGEPLGWGPEYQDNQELQSDFLEELNIPTYNNFKEFLFYDVVQALTKVYLVNVNKSEEEEEEASGEERGSVASMPDNQSQKQQRNSSNTVVPYTGEGQSVGRKTQPESNGPESSRKIVKRSKSLSHEEKVERRMELEFEELDDDKQDVMEVEEIRNKYKGLMKGFLSKQDQSLTSAHIKAGRKILAALRRLYEKKQHTQNQSPVFSYASDQGNSNRKADEPQLRKGKTWHQTGKSKESLDAEYGDDHRRKQGKQEYNDQGSHNKQYKHERGMSQTPSEYSYYNKKSHL